ncbi:MAG: hypothetical protein Q8M06_09700 [Methanobacteriaceae archaeon]|nr:hypothetical protein [Methanobacteriaceae archaeon]
MKSKMALLGIIAILMVVVAASGCTTNNETLLYEYNLTEGDAPNYIGAKNVTVPNGTNNIKVDAQNLEKINSNINQSSVNIYALSIVPVNLTVSGNNTELQKSYNSSIITVKTIDLINETSPKTISYTFDDTNIKGFLIVNFNAKGIIQIFTS